MSRYRGPKFRILKRLGCLPGFGTLLNKKLFIYLRKKKKNYIEENKKRRESTYNKRLKQKQKIKYNYGLTEKNMVNYIRKARKAKFFTSSLLFKFLEMRLDNIIFIYGYTPTIAAARQLITHGHILINNQCINKPSYQCQMNDVIEFKNNKFSPKYKPLKKFKHLYAKKKNIPNIKIQKKIPKREINLKINKLSVIEYYSRNL